MADLPIPKSTYPHFSFLYFIIIIISIFLLISSIQSQPINTNPSFYYNLCTPSRCNNLSLTYPFTLPNSCYPSIYKPICPTNQSLVLTSQFTTDTNRVLSLDYNDPTVAKLVIASNSLFTCGEQISRPNYRADGTIFSLPSNYTPGTHLNCTGPIPFDSIRGLQNASCLGCDGQDPNNFCYYAPGFVTYPTICENYHVFTPGGAFNASNVRDLRAFLQLGYEIRYVKPADCRGCEISGGRCGSQPISGSFVCFCQTSVHRMNCSDAVDMLLESERTYTMGYGCLSFVFIKQSE
ncbi:hypothetical protein AQUCO_01400374v1 [Aquilegia coerulea]|uniref:Wall-associated receptor kinase C-terminal domain-containing protein n=1 Tax=Aquilegia coerulea TaxID=218851 RepID=A0A2G5DWU7_AQUCA|nr:hypothetical protein AQUCO_01400374v1 [Aquilegia coerulea]